MMEMKRYKLSEICELNNATLKSSDNFDEILYLDTSNITKNCIAELQPFFIKNAPSRAQRKVKDKTIIFSTVRPNQKHFGILNNPPKNLIVSTGFTTLDVKKTNDFDANYVYLKLTQPYIVNHLHTLAQNSVSSYPSINPDDIGNLRFDFPPLSTQQKIAAVLSSLDDKIALNKKINTKLEAMAKRLYDYWFVQFDFPNEEGKPYKSSGGKMVWNEVLKREIPEGWEAVQIQSILDKHPSTKRYNTSEYLHEGKYPIVDQDSSTFIAGYTNEDDELLRRFPVVLFGDHSMCVKFLNFEFCRGADGTQILYSNDDRIKPYYLYLVVKSLTIPNQGYSRHFKYLKELPVILPSLELAAKFQEIVKPIYEKKTKCDKQIEKLSRLRDRLLPLLMNGQVKVEG